MVELFHDMMHKEIEVYVDDMIAKSKTEEEHFVNLQKLFERLRKYYLRLKPAKCNHRHEIFAHGGGARLAASLNVPFLGELPLVRELREGGDHASPIVSSIPAHPVSAAFKSIAAKVIEGLDRSEVLHAS